MIAAEDVSPAGSDQAARAARVIAAWAPRSLSPAAAGFARAVVERAAPPTPARAKALLFAAGRLAAFAERSGLELAPGVLLADATVERLVLCGCGGLSPASVRTLRANLRALARALAAYPEPAPVAVARDRAKAPYSPAEVEGYLRLAAAQSTQARRMRASALVCLGAGAGIVAGELRYLRGTPRGHPENPPGRASSESAGEGLPGNRIWKPVQALRRSASEVVDPIVGVRREADLGEPRPHAVRLGHDGYAAPGFDGRIWHQVVAWVATLDLGRRHTPAVADHTHTDSDWGSA